MSESTDPALVTTSEPEVLSPAMRKKDLLDAVVAQSGVKKRDAKPVVEAMLSVLGAAIAEGQELNLPEFGKLKIQRVKDSASARVTIAKIRQKPAL